MGGAGARRDRYARLHGIIKHPAGEGDAAAAAAAQAAQVRAAVHGAVQALLQQDRGEAAKAAALVEGDYQRDEAGEEGAGAEAKGAEPGGSREGGGTAQEKAAEA